MTQVLATSSAANGARPQAASAVPIVDEYEAREVSAHPLFVALRSAPVNLEAIWFLVANMNAGISPNFVRWLALTIARIKDNRVASLIAKQLDDELGNGNFENIHSVLLERFVRGLERWRPQRPGEDLLEAGRRLGVQASLVFEARDPYEAVGGLMVAEIFAKKMDRCLGDEIRRQDLVPPEALLWLDLHEVLEVHHAEDSRALALLVPERDDALASTRRGASELWDAMMGFLDGVASLAFRESTS